MKKFLGRRTEFAITLGYVTLLSAAFAVVLFVWPPQGRAGDLADAQASGAFFLFADDGAPRDQFYRTDLMGTAGGRDGSAAFDLHCTAHSIAGGGALRFGYTPPPNEPHWAGFMLLMCPDADFDISEYSHLRFWVMGSGGSVNFYPEFYDDGHIQRRQAVAPNEQWQEVAIALDASESATMRIPFGWSCNQTDISASAASITFWVDAIRFE